MKVAVVGGGIFGITIALKLAESGHKIDLFEMNGKLLSCASAVNQFRMHRGYHYPRSKETMIETREGFKKFKEFFEECLLEIFDHYYCMAKIGSLTSPEQFIKVCKELNLEYVITQPPEVVKSEKISLCLKVDEFMLSPSKLIKFCNENLKKQKVNVIFKKFTPSDIKKYDLIVAATYANQNYLLEKYYPEKMVAYQFEVVEKLVIKLPPSFRNLSIVIFDGPFMCIDPYDETEFHLMGNVVEAIHANNIGKFPEIPPKIKPLLNNGIIKNPKVTKFNEFISSAKEFFVDVEKAEHIGSMFTVRTVFPYHEHDDARPTVVRRISDKLITVFSGKIPTCVIAANEVIKEIQ
ncbi:MAG: FAD-dependent oxidoreductase [Candidatus Lokiarchaeia archaeon]